jgi:hypothetical protein
MRKRFIVAVVAIAGVLAVPSTASAWKWTFPQYDVGPGATRTVTATKCKGGPVGFYRYVGRITSATLVVDIQADMPAFPKLREFKNVQITISGSTAASLPPEVVAEIDNSYTTWLEATTSKVKKKKGRITFRYPALFLFGSQVIPAGQNTERFKPKKGC